MKKFQAFVSLFLTVQVFCFPSFGAWTPEEEDLFRKVCGGIPKSVDFKRKRTPYHLDPRLNETPYNDNPSVTGHVRPIFKCTIEGEKKEVILPERKLEARPWIREVDQDLHREVISLPIGFSFGGQWYEVHRVTRFLEHPAFAGNSSSDFSGKICFYNGRDFYVQESRYQTYQAPEGGIYGNVCAGDPRSPHGHKHTPFYVEPFDQEGRVPHETPSGEYRLIQTNKAHPKGRETGRLLVSNGGGRYCFPRTTQDLWAFINGEQLFGETLQRIFFIASWNSKGVVRFVDGTELPAGFSVHPEKGPSFLKRGIYHLLEAGGLKPAMGDLSSRRFERWRCLDSSLPLEKSTFEIEFPPCYPSSIPGMGGSAPRILSPPSLGGIQSYIDVRQKIDEISKKVQRQRELYKEAVEQVIFLGSTRSGKSTLITGLFRDLEVFESDTGWVLGCPDPLGDIIIGGENFHESCTRVPTAYYDVDEKRLYWDTTGFEDSSGKERDLINAFAIAKIFENESLATKIVFVDRAENLITGDSVSFINRLRLLTGLFPQQDNLASSLLFAFNRNTRALKMENIFRRLWDSYSQNGGDTPDAPLVPILTLLKDHTEERTLLINEPRDEIYEFNREGLMERIGNTRPIKGLKLDIRPILEKGVGHLNSFVQVLGEHTLQFIRHEIFQNILHGCRRKIELHQGTASELRKVFQGVLSRLKKPLQGNGWVGFMDYLRGIGSPWAEETLNVRGLRTLKDQWQFIQRVDASVREPFGEWHQLIHEGLKKKIALLIQPPSFDLVQGEEASCLSIEAPFLGISDVKTICEKASHPFSFVRVFVGCKFFFDGDVSLRGKHLSIVGPMGHVSQACTIDLSGLDGKDGAHGSHGTFPGGHGGHGSPGDPGGNGGNFVAFFHDVQGQAKDLTINLSGGKGGRGGNGGNGAPGANGHTENRPRVPTDEAEYQNFITRIKNPRDIFSENTIGDFSMFCPGVNIIKGKEGFRGGNGGKAGVGSQGGLEGYGISWSLRGAKIIKKPVNTGSRDGQPGQGGNGGQHGTDVIAHTCFSNDARGGDNCVNWEKVFNPQYRAVKGKKIHYMKDIDSLKSPKSPYTLKEANNYMRNLCTQFNFPKKQLESFRDLYPRVLASLNQNRGRAPSGQAGQGVNGQPRGPGPRIEVDISQLRRAFDTFYIEAAQKDALAPFLGFPPSFEEEDGASQERR